MVETFLKMLQFFKKIKTFKNIEKQVRIRYFYCLPPLVRGIRRFDFFNFFDFLIFFDFFLKKIRIIPYGHCCRQ